MSPVTEAGPFDIHPTQKESMGRIQWQDPDLQHKLSTNRFRPGAVVLWPCCLQWIFVYSPQVSARPPLTPLSGWNLIPWFPPILSPRFLYPSPRPLLSPRAEMSLNIPKRFFYPHFGISIPFNPRPRSETDCQNHFVTRKNGFSTVFYHIDEQIFCIMLKKLPVANLLTLLSDFIHSI